LKNASATYQRAMNYIFHDLIGKLVEIYWQHHGEVCIGWRALGGPTASSGTNQKIRA
jgi:hypothetical protein